MRAGKAAAKGLTPEQIGDEILADKHFDPRRQNIYLEACNTGNSPKGGKSFAQKLADYLTKKTKINIVVYAPNTTGLHRGYERTSWTLNPGGSMIPFSGN